jgi:hypothetical protein
LTKPSAVTPYDDHGMRKSSVARAVLFSSRPPTVMMNGSFAGAPIGTGPFGSPAFPDEATTTMPLSHSFSTALSSGLNAIEEAVVEPSDMLTTRMLYWLL